jgi:hypothetical protein
MPQMLVEALQQFSPGCAPRDLGNSFGAIAEAVGQDRYVIALVGSDASGHPVPNSTAHTGHWVAVYDVSNGYSIANSGSGNDENYSEAYFASSFRGIVVDTGLGPGTSPNEDEDMTINVARGIIEAILGSMGFNPPTGEQVEAYAAQIARGANVETVVSACIADCSADPRCWPKRIAELEVAIASLREVAHTR